MSKGGGKVLNDYMCDMLNMNIQGENKEKQMVRIRHNPTIYLDMNPF